MRHESLAFTLAISVFAQKEKSVKLLCFKLKTAELLLKVISYLIKLSWTKTSIQLNCFSDQSYKLFFTT